MHTKYWYPLILLLAFALPAKSQTYVFAQLKGPQVNTSGWNFSGAARVANVTSNDNSEILLTPALNNSSGAVFFDQPINLTQCKRWKAEFDYRLFDGSSADGLAFCFLDAPPTGFQNASNLGIPKTARGLKICIDTWNNCNSNPGFNMPKVEARWGQGYGIYNNSGTLVTEGECRTDSSYTVSNVNGQLAYLRSSGYTHVIITYNDGNLTVKAGALDLVAITVPAYNFPGYIGFTASTGGSNDNQSIKNVVIYTEMPPSEAGSSPTPVCPGATVQIGTVTNSQYIYSWSPAGGLSSTNISNPVATAANSTGNIVYQKYFVKTSFSNNPGCASTDSVIITVNPGPLTDFDAPVVCLPEAGTVTIKNKTVVNDGNQAQVKYNWTFSDGGTSTAENPTHTYTAAGNYSITLLASSGTDCKTPVTKNFVINPKAKAAITTSAPSGGFCQDTTMQFNGSIGNLSAQSWYWDFNDNSTGNTQNPLHTYATSKTYNVKMYAVTTEGCHSDTTSTKVIIDPLPVAGFTRTGLLCDGQSIHFTDASKPSVGTLQAYRWVFDNDFADPRNPTDKSFTTGNHTVSITVKNSQGCFSKPYTESIYVGPAPVADFTVPLVCKDASGIYTDASTIADGTESKFTYAWDFGDGGNPGTGKTPAHTYTTAGDHQVKMTVSSGNGCTATATKTVTISDFPNVDFTILTTNFCSNLPLQLKDNSSVQYGTLSSLSFYWDASQPNFTQVNNPVAGDIYTHNYPSFGYTNSLQVTLKVRAYSSGGCYTEKTGTSILFASPKLVFGPIPTYCQNGTQVITLNQARDTSAFPGTGYYTGDGVSNGTFTPSAAGPGTHTITYHYKLDANNCADTISQTAVVGIKPKVSAGPSQVILKGGQTTLQGSATGGTNIVYAWTPIANLNDYTVLNPVASPATDTYYTLKATNGDGCFDTSGTLVKVLQFPVVPNAFSPNNDGINDTWQISYISSYPDCKVQVFNRYGQQVFVSTGYTKPWDGLHHGDPAPVGTYYYIITSAHLPVPLSGSVTLLR